FVDPPVSHPGMIPDLRGRMITIGSVTKTFRMIGWRVGWLIAPRPLMDALTRAVLFSGSVTATGIAQAGAAAAFDALGDGDAGIDASVSELRRRHDLVLAAARPYGAIPAAGGWTLLVNVSTHGWTSLEAARRLLDRGRIAATPMDAWGLANGP